MISYVTDIEGRGDKWASFLDGNPHVSEVDGELELAEGVTFVFGGDAVDRGPYARRFVGQLLRAKRRYGDRVVLLAGNRDINKLRLVTELGGKPHRRAPAGLALPELLRWTFTNTMGAKQAFDHRVTELAEQGLPSSEMDVVETYLVDLADRGELRAYLEVCQLGYRAGDTLFVHGGVSAENFLATPARCEDRWITAYTQSTSIDAWLASLDRFYRGELETFARGQRPDALIAYQAQGPDKLNQQSVVYARPTDDNGNPHLPPAAIVQRLQAEGVARVVVGHTPSGDCPAILRDGAFELVLADNSYSRLELGSQVAIDHATHVRSHTVLDDGTQHSIAYTASVDDRALGLRDRQTGQLVKSRLGDGYLVFRGLPNYQVEQLAVTEQVAASRPLVPARD